MNPNGPGFTPIRSKLLGHTRHFRKGRGAVCPSHRPSPRITGGEGANQGQVEPCGDFHGERPTGGTVAPFESSAGRGVGRNYRLAPLV